MITSAAILQLCRILGKNEFYQRLLPEADAAITELTQERLGHIHSLVQERLQLLVDAFLEEALSNDDILSAEAAEAYLEERLDFFGDLLSEEQRYAVRQGYRRISSQWV